MFEKEGFSSWFKENTPKEGLSENTTFSRQFLSDAWDNGYNNGYNKANEWHYVKDGDLPKTHGWYFVCYNNDTFDCAIVTKDLRFLNFYTSKDMTEAVYAWKEIVLPKLSNGGE
jgi:hypothetical protein